MHQEIGPYPEETDIKSMNCYIVIASQIYNQMTALKGLTQNKAIKIIPRVKVLEHLKIMTRSCLE